MHHCIISVRKCHNEIFNAIPLDCPNWWENIVTRTPSGHLPQWSPNCQVLTRQTKGSQRSECNKNQQETTASGLRPPVAPFFFWLQFWKVCHLKLSSIIVPSHSFPATRNFFFCNIFLVAVLEGSFRTRAVSPPGHVAFLQSKALTRPDNAWQCLPWCHRWWFKDTGNVPSKHVIIEILLRPGIQGRARKCLMFVSECFWYDGNNFEGYWKMIKW